jgi:hypothetical protein
VAIEELAGNASLIAAMRSAVRLNNEGQGFNRMGPLMSNQQTEKLRRELASNRPYNKNTDALDKVIAELRLDGREEVRDIGDKADTMRRQAVADENRLDTLRAEVTSPLVDWVLKWVSPLLLALALAVRVTRVTAEVFVLKKGESLSANQPAKAKEQEASIAQLESTVAQQKKDFQATATQLTARLDAQESEIQKVNAQLAATKPAPPVVNNP